ncbi:hypothetical protein ACRQU7_01430 [Caproiciproducens sp. R1]|uniref:hypothetical protein n=1 Tax=Acutalibacteraceae TaxID=3082771 RepID=UPI002E0E691C
MRLKHFFRSPWRLLITTILFILLMLLASQYGKALISVEGFFLWTFDVIGPWEQVNIMSVLLFTVSNLLIFFSTGNLFLEDMKVSYVYIFPRIGTKRTWLRQQTFGLLLWIAFFWIVIFLLAFCFAGAAGLEAQGSALFYVEQYLCTMLSSFLLSFLQNLLSLHTGSSQAFIITACIFVGSLFVGMFTYQTALWNGWLFALLPPVGQILHWHPDAAIPQAVRQTLASYAPVPGFALWKSFVVLLIYWILLYGYLYLKIEKADLMDLIKEEN